MVEMKRSIPAHAFPARDRRAVALALALTTSVIAMLLATVLLHARPASADSSIGGKITANEVMQRAAYWYSQAPSYSQSSYSWDVNHSREYRHDCSGFIDMALHLGTDYNTDGIAASSLFSNEGWASTSLSTTDVRPGDVFDDTADGHAFLFEGWAADGVHMSYYNFGGGSSGVAPPEHHVNEVFDSSVGGEITTHYRIFRYQNLLYTDGLTSGAFDNSAGYQHIFLSTSAGAVAQRYNTASGWTWDSIDGTILTGAVAVNYFPDNNEYDVYATGTNGNLYVKEYVGGNWGSSWTLIDGPSLQAGVSAMLDVYGHQHVFASGTDGAVYNIRNATIGADGKHGSWNFYNIGGTILAKTPGVNYFPATNEYDVYATGTNGHLYEKDYVNGNWAGSWSDRGDHNLAGGAAAMVDKYGHQHVFAITTGHVMYNSRNTSGSSWTWDALPGSTTLLGTPKLQYDFDSNTYNVWAPGTDGELYHQEYASSAWFTGYHDFSGGSSINVTG
jgi:hypothetical protein